MRILIDALASTKRSGGMRLHSRELINAWVGAFDDDLHILGPAGQAHEYPGTSYHPWPNETIPGRSVGQLIVSPYLTSRLHVDATISLSPIVSPLIRNVPTVAFQHDWRHKRLPGEFSYAQKAYRSLWALSAKQADLNACISTKAARETRLYIPTAKTTIVENGRDHARAWAMQGKSDQPATVVTFGHHNNKRPELVLQAVALLGSQGIHLKLTILGTRDFDSERLQLEAARRGFLNLHTPGFVSDSEYQEIVSSSSIIILASTDEGFGLPVAEAEYLGIPAIITSDSGMEEFFADYANVAAPNGAAIADQMKRILSNPRRNDSDERHTQTWKDAAQKLRDAVKLLMKPSSHGR